MTHLDFVSAKETLLRLTSTLKPLNKGFSFILSHECVRPLAFAWGEKKREAQDDNKKERLGVIRIEKKSLIIKSKKEEA
jgi:hypothetical protein